MKTFKLLFIGSCLVWLAAFSGSAQTYDLSWFAIAGGGGTSTGGVYSVSGTIGQPDTGTLSGGNYTITGGFWSAVVAVPSSGSPQLTVLVSGHNVTISWPSPSSGFVLQESSSLNPASWNPATQTVNDDGTNRSITLTLPAGSKFYRLTY